MPALTTIKLRRGTAAEWTAANPVLAAGEEGHESDTGLRKVGNGATAWNALAYFNPVPPGTYVPTPATSETAFGKETLQSQTTGFGSTAFGLRALRDNTSGTNNSAFGVHTLLVNTTGHENSAFGLNALTKNTTGYYNTAMGAGALGQNTTGYNNTGVGIDTLSLNSTGHENCALGVDALGWNVSGHDNAALGMNALYSNITGDANTGIGFDALFANVSGTRNVGIGAFSGFIVPNTAGMTVTPTSGSANLGVGAHYYKVSFVLDGAETALSEDSYKVATTNSGAREVTIAGIPTYTGPLTCTARKLYRTTAGPGVNYTERHYMLLTTIANNTTTGFVDTVADGSLGAENTLGPSNCITLGYDARAFKSGQAVVGSTAAPITEMWLGAGIHGTAGGTFQMASTGGEGADALGTDFIVAGGPGTGAGVGGSVFLKTAAGGSSGPARNALTTRLGVTSGGLSYTRGVVGQPVNLYEWQNDAGTVLSYMGPDATFHCGPYLAGSSGSKAYWVTPETSGAGWQLQNRGASGAAVLTVRGEVGQSGALQEWQNSASAVVSYVASDGTFHAGAYLAGSSNTKAYWTTPETSGGSWELTNRGAAGLPPLVVRGQAGQTGSLTEWQNSSLAVLSRIGPEGRFMTRVNSAPADALLANGEMALWFDSTNGAAKLMVKAKQADGTVRTGSLALA